MCHPVRCRTCGRTTWAGCGSHVASVRARVPAGQWCDGRHTPSEIAVAKESRPGLFARLFGR